MYVSAQRVMNPKTHARGVNLFKYTHGGASWASVPDDYLPDSNPGELIWQDLQLAPPGNRVLSYLDVVAPDTVSRDELCDRLAVLKAVLKETGEPTVARWNPLWIRYGLGFRALPWTTELGALAGHLVLRLPAG